MKLPMPRLGVCVGLWGIGVVTLVAGIKLHKAQSPSPSPLSATDYFMVAAWGAVFLWVLLYALREVSSFYVLGETHKFDVQLQSGQILQLGPFCGLFGKSLILDFTNDLPAEYKPKIKPLGVYLSYPVQPVVHYDVQLLGSNEQGGETTLISEAKVAERLYSSSSNNDKPYANWETEVTYDWNFYTLKIKIHDIELNAKHKPLAAERGGIATIPVRIRGSVRVGLKPRMLSRLREVSVKSAKTQIMTPNASSEN